MNFVLILTLYFFPSNMSSQTGVSSTIESVAGFTSEEDCKRAGQSWVNMQNASLQMERGQIRVNYTCIVQTRK